MPYALHLDVLNATVIDGMRVYFVLVPFNRHPPHKYFNMVNAQYILCVMHGPSIEKDMGLYIYWLSNLLDHSFFMGLFLYMCFSNQSLSIRRQWIGARWWFDGVVFTITHADALAKNTLGLIEPDLKRTMRQTFIKIMANNLLFFLLYYRWQCAISFWL